MENGVYLIGFNQEVNKNTGEISKVAVVSKGVNGQHIPFKIVTDLEEVTRLYNLVTKKPGEASEEV